MLSPNSVSLFMPPLLLIPQRSLRGSSPTFSSFPLRLIERKERQKDFLLFAETRDQLTFNRLEQIIFGRLWDRSCYLGDINSLFVDRVNSFYLV